MEQKQNIPAPQANLVVLEKDRIRVYPLDQREKWLMGRQTRNSQPDIPVNSKIVSRSHGWLMGVEGDWYYVDNPENLNGTFLNGSRIRRPVSGIRKPVSLHCGDVLRIDCEEADPDLGAVTMLYTTRPIRGRWQQHFLRESQLLTVGSGSGCDLRCPEGAVVQGKISGVNGRFYLEPCTGEIVLNGTVLREPAVLRSGDCFAAGGSVYFFLGDRVIYEG